MVGATAMAQARWRGAEDRLYPLAMTDPERYRHALESVRTLVEHLRRSTRTIDELLAVEASPAALLAALPADRVPLPADVLVQAACGSRAREIAAETDAERRAAAITAARAEGRDWVVLDGPADIAELIGGRAVCVHLPTGATIVAGVDRYSGGDPYQLEELATGDRPGRDRSFSDRDAWIAEHGRWCEEITSS